MRFESRHAYDVVVLAADGISGAAVAGTHTDDSDGRAVEADERIDVVQDNAEQREDDRDHRVRCLQDIQRTPHQSRSQSLCQGGEWWGVKEGRRRTDWTCWQHWMEPVLHWLTVVTVGAGAVTVTVTVGGLFGMAAARKGAINKTQHTGTSVRANIVKLVVRCAGLCGAW